MNRGDLRPALAWLVVRRKATRLGAGPQPVRRPASQDGEERRQQGAPGARASRAREGALVPARGGLRGGLRPSSAARRFHRARPADHGRTDALASHEGAQARRAIIDVYTAWEWPALCEAVSCLRVDPDRLPGRIYDISYDICVLENAHLPRERVNDRTVDEVLRSHRGDQWVRVAGARLADPVGAAQPKVRGPVRAPRAPGRSSRVRTCPYESPHRPPAIPLSLAALLERAG